MIGLRGWMVAIGGAALIAVAVLAASERQRSTSQTNFKEAQAAAQMQVAMLSQERGLDGFLSSGDTSNLERLYESKLRLLSGLTDARRLSRDDAAERTAVTGQADAFAAWSSLASAAIQRRQTSGAEDSATLERQRSLVIDDFLDDNDAYQARLLVNRFREEGSAALLPVWLMLALGAMLGITGAAIGERKRRAAKVAATFDATQARFIEAIQFAADETEAHELLEHHLETTVAGGSVLVLNRNNSADRLEATRALPPDHPLREPLLGSEPRSCLAVRLSRRYSRGNNAETTEALTCKVCGELARPSSCEPLLVGGEVIGSVLVEHDERLTREADARLHASVAQAAPVLANLRNLAIAQDRAATDALTGLPNRRSVDDTLRRMLAQAERAAAPLSIAMLDLDHFKQINDNYGHEAGDNALAALATLLHAELRTSDFAGRNGGEEFVIFLPATERADAITVVDQIRLKLHTLQIPGIDRQITASIGVATFPDDATTPEALMRLTDRALYSAKQHGRDRVETTTPARTPPNPIAA
jgi:diguanylate cyclase (GGDEF)-like protein